MSDDNETQDGFEKVTRDNRINVYHQGILSGKTVTNEVAEILRKCPLTASECQSLIWQLENSMALFYRGGGIQKRNNFFQVAPAVLPFYRSSSMALVVLDHDVSSLSHATFEPLVLALSRHVTEELTLYGLPTSIADLVLKHFAPQSVKCLSVDCGKRPPTFAGLLQVASESFCVGLLAATVVPPIFDSLQRELDALSNDSNLNVTIDTNGWDCNEDREVALANGFAGLRGPEGVTLAMRMDCTCISHARVNLSKIIRHKRITSLKVNCYRANMDDEVASSVMTELFVVAEGNLTITNFSFYNTRVYEKELPFHVLAKRNELMQEAAVFRPFNEEARAPMVIEKICDMIETRECYFANHAKNFAANVNLMEQSQDGIIPASFSAVFMIVRNHLAPLLAGHCIAFVPSPGEFNYKEVFCMDWQELAGVDLTNQSRETLLWLTKLSIQRGLQAEKRTKRRIDELAA